MSIRKRNWPGPDGEPRESWVADYFDTAGKRRLKTFKRKRDAEIFLNQAKVDVRAGTHVPDSASITVQAASALWLESCRGRGLERSTLEQYGRHARFHILPFIGSVRLSALNAPAVRDFEDRLRRGDGPAVEGVSGPRSQAMIKKVMTSLSALLADAQERGLVVINAARDMRAKRRTGAERQAAKRQKGKLKVGVDIPAPAEIRMILAHVDARWRPIILTAVFSGLRSSELRGLQWHDVDLKNGRLHVRRRVDQYGNFGPPKSAAGERTVPLPPEVINELREWKLRSPKGEHDLVFPTRSGTVQNHANIVNRGLVPAQIAAGVVDKSGAPKYSGLHSLRHFYASLCIKRSV
jgi:integrase